MRSQCESQSEQLSSFDSMEFFVHFKSFFKNEWNIWFSSERIPTPPDAKLAVNQANTHIGFRYDDPGFVVFVVSNVWRKINVVWNAKIMTKHGRSKLKPEWKTLCQRSVSILCIYNSQNGSTQQRTANSYIVHWTKMRKTNIIMSISIGASWKTSRRTLLCINLNSEKIR